MSIFKNEGKVLGNLLKFQSERNNFERETIELKKRIRQLEDEVKFYKKE